MVSAPVLAVRNRPAKWVNRTKAPAKVRVGFRGDVEGLRAIAVVSVVLYHFGLLHISGGYVGVDVFFVISGFLITRQLTKSIAADGLRALPHFYAARFRRLLPAAAVLIVAVYVAIRLWVPLLQQPQMLRDGAASALYSMNYTLAVRKTEYLHASDAPSPFQHFWSLGVEEQFYLLWPAVIVLIFAVTARRRLLVLGAVASVAGGFSLYSCITLSHSSNSWAYFSLWTRWWELALGALVALAASTLAALPRWLSPVCTVAGLTGIGWASFQYSDHTLYPGTAAVVPVVATALVIVGGTIRPDARASQVLGYAPMRFLGGISYSLYLWHWPVVVLAPYALGGSLSTTTKWGLVALSVACATQSYWIVESGTRGLRLAWVRWCAAGLAATVVVASTGWSLAASTPKVVGTGKVASIATVDARGAGPVAKVQSIVADGLLTKAAPRNLTPSPSKAPNDVPRANYNGCHADYQTVKQGACVYGDPTGSHTAVLFGDSHLEQWQPGFDVAGKKAGWKIVNWTKAGCPFATVTIFNASLNQNYANCDSWRTATMTRIAALHPDVVFLGEYEDIADGQISNSAWVTASAKTAAWFRAHTTAKIVFLTDSPKPTTTVPTCVSQSLSDVERCAFSEIRSVIRWPRHRALAVAMKAAGAQVVDTHPWLCPNGECPVVVGNLLVYRDESHLTATFSAWMAPVLQTLLTPRA